MEVLLLMLTATALLAIFLSCAIDVPLNVKPNTVWEEEFTASWTESRKCILQVGGNDRKCSVPGLYCSFLFSLIFFFTCRSVFDAKMIQQLMGFLVAEAGRSISEVLCVGLRATQMPVQTLLRSKSHHVPEHTWFCLTGRFQLRAQKNPWS